MRRDIAAVAVLATLAPGCGKAASLTHRLRRHPSPFAHPRGCVRGATLGRAPLLGRPASALICSYWGRSGRPT
jgi:hypothetical protein